MYTKLYGNEGGGKSDYVSKYLRIEDENNFTHVFGFTKLTFARVKPQQAVSFFSQSKLVCASAWILHACVCELR